MVPYLRKVYPRIWKAHTWQWLPRIVRYDGLRVGYSWLGIFVRWPDTRAWNEYEAYLRQSDD